MAKKKKNKAADMRGEYKRKLIEKAGKNAQERQHSAEDSSAEAHAAAASSSVQSRRTKPLTKMAGVKSLFHVSGDQYIMTSFGKGNKAVIEKELNCGGEITDINNESAIRASFREGSQVDIDITGNGISASGRLENRNDLIGLKSRFEKSFLMKALSTIFIFSLFTMFLIYIKFCLYTQTILFIR